jgi:cytochrome c1
VEPGSMTPEEFDMAMADLVNFMAYVAEPYKLDRERIGKWVLLYLALAFVVFYLLKKEYWKDVH